LTAVMVTGLVFGLVIVATTSPFAPGNSRFVAAGDATAVIVRLLTVDDCASPLEPPLRPTVQLVTAYAAAAESTTPGQYGTVIEAGMFPHDRSAPYARRWLDGRGRVPPNSLILRPSASPDDPYLDFPAGGAAQEAEDKADDFSAPAWLRIERRSRARTTPSRAESHDGGSTEEWPANDAFVAPPWLKIERRSRSRPQGDGFESYGEDFTFDPTGTQQAWLVGTGTYTGNVATIDSVLYSPGTGKCTTTCNADSSLVKVTKPALSALGIYAVELTIPSGAVLEAHLYGAGTATGTAQFAAVWMTASGAMRGDSLTATTAAATTFRIDIAKRTL